MKIVSNFLLPIFPKTDHRVRMGFFCVSKASFIGGWGWASKSINTELYYFRYENYYFLYKLLILINHYIKSTTILSKTFCQMTDIKGILDTKVAKETKAKF